MAAAPRGPGLTKPVSRAGMKARGKGKGAYRGSQAALRRKPAFRGAAKGRMAARYYGRSSAVSAKSKAGKAPARAPAKRGDAIDDILRKFK